MSEPFRFPVRVYYEDTDAGGVVYHANYLRYAERARTEFLRARGVEQREMREAEDFAFVVRRCTVDYRAPAVLDDALEVITRITGVRGAALEAVQEVVRQGESDPLVVMDLVIAGVNGRGRPVRLPQKIRDLVGGSAPA
ncbi:tol-pal system-associated acyl-CoA thioesterase [Thalassobaculum sp. OXR-137]|uniref:tol-pal system-associated acyl-CoA thioesterase n=1 Tax=Thalassobaculum sp. OXR-137 TaxID=3100173 RepID=UPI002AC913A3|nr:tol-pal system-associated acyl-CoA thioesterase [Thalassobaculum sp. OXR-137]WPZ36918.1 tol-pal system-associated acyl-CoA thioesterase [Thalassobaculum sp. OXR-137]